MVRVLSDDTGPSVISIYISIFFIGACRGGRTVRRHGPHGDGHEAGEGSYGKLCRHRRYTINNIVNVIPSIL